MYWFGGRMVVPITPQGYNADLKWETTTTYNAGIDLGFWQDRLTAHLDAYYRVTTDLLNSTPIPAGANLTNQLVANIGTLVNKGVELDLEYIALQSKDLFWQIGFNAAYNKNTVTKLTANDTPDYKGVPTGGYSGGNGNTIQRFMVGEPVNTFYVWQQVYDVNGKPIPGLYVDRNHDGTVDEDDKYCFKKPAPDFTFGLNTNFSWKNLTVAASAHANVGNWVYNNNLSQFSYMNDLWTNNFTANRLAAVQQVPFYTAEYESDYFVENASFFKLDNVTVGYTFPKIFKAADRDASLNIFATVQNVFVISGYSGIDPEVFNGIDSNLWPRPRTYVLGVKFNF
jgi:iron complex outermembrane receptor protein